MKLIEGIKCGINTLKWYRTQVIERLSEMMNTLFSLKHHMKDVIVALPFFIAGHVSLFMLQIFKASDETIDLVTHQIGQTYYFINDLISYTWYYINTHVDNYLAGLLVLGCALLFIHVKWLKALYLLSWFFYVLYLKEYFIRHPIVVAKISEIDEFTELKDKHRALEIKYQKATALIKILVNRYNLKRKL
jgi:hypothetical protein